MKKCCAARSKPPKGFMLMEVLLAFMIFSITITGITMALNSSQKIVQNAERNAWVQEQLDYYLTETLTFKQESKDEFVGETIYDLGQFGAEAQIVVTEETELETAEGEPLQDLYLITITLTWLDSAGIKQEESLETYYRYNFYKN